MDWSVAVLKITPLVLQAINTHIYEVIAKKLHMNICFTRQGSQVQTLLRPPTKARA